MSLASSGFKALPRSTALSRQIAAAAGGVGRRRYTTAAASTAPGTRQSTPRYNKRPTTKPTRATIPGKANINTHASFATMPLADSEPDAVQISSPHAGITVISINRQHRRNAVNTATALKLYAAFQAFEADPDAHVAVFHGQHGTFCAGYDLHTVSESPTLAAPIPNLDPNDASRTPGPMGPSRLQIKKPVITAVSGWAVAGGTELSLLGDMRVVEEDAHFGIFCRRWGVPLLDGGTVRLQAIVGLGRALDMILTGRPVGAQEALAMGLANRVVPKGKAVEAAVEIARELLKFPQACMRADRDSCYNACFNAKSWEEALKFEFVNGLQCLKDEGVAGAGRFSKGAGRHADFSKL